MCGLEEPRLPGGILLTRRPAPRIDAAAILLLSHTRRLPLDSQGVGSDPPVSILNAGRL